MELDFIVDKLTHSIVCVQTNAVCETDVFPLYLKDLPQITKKTGWRFNWKKELKEENQSVFKLVICDKPDIIHGLVCLSKDDNFIFMNLLESAPFNVGRRKEYDGVAGNLVAYACKWSFECGFEGVIAFEAKTLLMQHYREKLGAICLGGQRMSIETKEAYVLVNRYYGNK